MGILTKGRSWKIMVPIEVCEELRRIIVKVEYIEGAPWVKNPLTNENIMKVLMEESGRLIVKEVRMITNLFVESVITQ